MLGLLIQINYLFWERSDNISIVWSKNKECFKGLLCQSPMFQQESGMALITAEDLDDAAQKAVKAYKWRVPILFKF